MPYPLNNLFQSTWNGDKHISWHQNHPKLPGSSATPWSGPGSCCSHCWWCLCIFDIAEKCSNQLSRVKNVCLDTKINLLQCQGAELHLKVGLDPVVGSVVGVGRWCTFFSSDTCSNQLSMVKNIYMDTKINLLQCQRAGFSVEQHRQMTVF